MSSGAARADQDLIKPRFHNSPPRDFTEGPLVADLLADCADDRGLFILDPEQRLIVDDAFAYVRDVSRAGGVRLACFEQCIVAPRQNLKTGALKAIALGKIYISEQRLVVWTAHRATACQEAFRDLKILIESNPDMLAEVEPGGFHTAANNLSIHFTGDRRIVFMTRTADAAQSFSGDTVIIDEAYKLEPDFIASLAPTLLARPNPQIIYGSSAGHLRSSALRSLRDRGRVGESGLAYIEWSATPRPCKEPDCDHALDAKGCILDSEAAWRECNTALARGRMTLDALRGLRKTLSADPMKFGRECLCLWDDPGQDSAESPLDADVFAKLRQGKSRIVDELPVFALDLAPRRKWAGIVAAGRNADGLIHVEVPSKKGSFAYWRGPSKVLPTFRRLRRRFAGARVRMLAKGQAVPYARTLIELGYEVELVDPGDYLRMCTDLVDAVENGEVVHLGDHVLIDNVRVAAAKDIGEELWRWTRPKSGGDITLLVNMTMAVDGVRNGPPASIYETRGPVVL